MSRFRLLALTLFSLPLALPVSGDELDFVPVVETDTPAPAAPLDRALKPVAWFLRAAHPAFHYSYARAEGVLSAPGLTQKTTVQSISGSVYFHLGQFAALRYQPAWTFYSSDTFDDNFGHDAAFQWRRGFVEWNFRFDHRYAQASIPMIETGSQTSEETHISSFQAQRSLGSRTTLELGLSHRLRLVDAFVGNRLWATDDWLHYHLTGAISLSGGISVGYIDADSGANMSFQQLNTRFRWRVTDRLRLDVRGGVETRKFHESQRDNATTPIYGAKLIYQALEHTTVMVSGDQSVSLSYFRDRIHRTSTWQVGISQRLVGRLQLDAAYIYRGATFSSTTDAIVEEREDDGRAIRFDLRTVILRRGTIGVFYQHKRNHSSERLFDFTGRQIGADLSFRY